MTQISNENLILEAIRRKRSKKTPLPTGGFTGSPFCDVMELLNHWMSTPELSSSLRNMIEEKSIAMSIRFLDHTHGGFYKNHQTGVLERLHPDVRITSDYLYFTVSGTQLMPRFSKKTGMRICPDSQKMSFSTIHIKMLHIVADGLSKTTSRSFANPVHLFSW